MVRAAPYTAKKYIHAFARAAPTGGALMALRQQQRAPSATEAASPTIADPWLHGNVFPLTAREREVLQLLARGCAAAEISRELCISHATVRNHIQHILAKLGLHSKLEAVAYAYRRGLIQTALQA
jgi:DNA-binding NarL/FixJ family response regulator